MDMVEKVVNEKYYGKSDTEKVDSGRLYYLYTNASFLIFLQTLIFVYLLFLLEVSEVSN